jgi:hypothetical protein
MKSSCAQLTGFETRSTAEVFGAKISDYSSAVLRIYRYIAGKMQFIVCLKA